MEIYTVYPWHCLLVRGEGPRRMPVILSTCRMEQDGEHPLGRFPPRDRQPLGSKMSWCHGGLSRTISMISVPPPPYCRVTNAQRLPFQTLHLCLPLTCLETPETAWSPSSPFCFQVQDAIFEAYPLKD